MKQIGRIIGVLALFYALFIVVGYFGIRQAGLKTVETSLQELQNRVRNDLQYKNGKWDTTFYNADPSTPHPQGSSGAITPLYIMTTDGFVIERNQPVHGLLDSSDFKHLLTLQNPQTLTIVTNDQWRVVSQPIQNTQGTVLGVIIVARHNPEPTLIPDVDSRLRQSLDLIAANVKVNGNTVDSSHVDIRTVEYDIAFEIVDRFNNVLLSNGRVPTFIDPGYITQTLQTAEQTRTLADERTKERFLIASLAITDTQNEPIGIIVTGGSITFIERILQSFLTNALIFAVVTLVPFAYAIRYVIKSSLQVKDEESEIVHPKNITFDASDSVLVIDDTRVEIPYATNQYALLKALFSAPQRRWELDELLERFGENEMSDGWRKVYDATLAVNRKVGFKLIEYKDKTFRLHPQVVSRIS